MKKIFVYFMTFVLMMNLIICNIAWATQEEEVNQEISAQTEEVPNPEIPKTDSVVESAMPEIVKANAIVTEIEETQQIQTDYMTDTTQKIKVEILDGEYETKEFETEYILAYDMDQKIKDYELKVGDQVTVQIIDNKDGNITVQIQDVVRINYVFIMVVVFLVALTMIVGKQAIKPILTLIIIALITYLVLLKGIDAGGNAVFVVLGFVSITTILNFGILTGWNKKTVSLILATLLGAICSMILGRLFIYISKISGISENIIQLSMNMAEIEFSFKNVMLVAIVVMSLGVNMNLAMYITTALEEQKNKTADTSRREVFKKGMNIGKKQIANWLNTIILFGIGTSVALMLAFSSCNISFLEMLNKESIVEIAIAVISISVSLLVMIPIISGIYALLNYKKSLYRTTSENKLDGNRSLKI